jgi:hypothetical protein
MYLGYTNYITNFKNVNYILFKNFVCFQNVNGAHTAMYYDLERVHTAISVT